MPASLYSRDSLRLPALQLMLRPEVQRPEPVRTLAQLQKLHQDSVVHLLCPVAHTLRADGEVKFGISVVN